MRIAMHLPDSSLDNVTCTVTTLLAAGAVGYACRRALRDTQNRSASAFAATAAFIFAVQMVNFPVADGVSGHMVGGTLAGAILGPWLGLLAMTLVLIAQCLLAGDGGLTTLGANILTMGVVATWGGYALKNALSPGAKNITRDLAASAFAAWGSIVAAGAVCAIIWAAGSSAPLESVLGPMLAVHARIGLGEALVTAAALGAMAVWNAQSSVAAYKCGAITAFASAIAVAALLAPWASSSPDGLEHVAAQWTAWQPSDFTFAPLPDYLLPGVGSESLATALAGALGTLAVFGVARLTGQVMSYAPQRATGSL